MMQKTKYILVAGALLSFAGAFAQQKNIDTIVFKVSEQYKPIVTDANKINSNPTIADTIRPVRKVDYQLIGNQYSTSYTPDALQAVQIKGEPLDKLQHSLLNIGGGNYNTLYGEYFFNALRSRDFDYGIHLNHLSSDATLANEGYSGYSYNDVNMYGKLFRDNHVIYVQGDFDQHVVHDYGYNTSLDQLSNATTRQRFNLIDGLVQYTSHFKDSTAVNHDIKLSAYNYSDLYSVNENNIEADAHLFSYIQHQRLDVKAFIQDFADQTNNANTSSVNMLFNPYFSTIEAHWDAHIGFKVYFTPLPSQFNVLPDLVVRYHVVPNVFIIYAGIDGSKQYNSYKSLTAINPFMQDTMQQLYTLTSYHVFGGITGNITTQLSYDINGSQSEVKNMPLFVTDTLEPLRNRFAVVYDNVKVTNFHLDLNYEMNRDLHFTLGGDYNQYTPTNQLKAWYHPALKINLTGRYSINDKYIFSTEIFVLGSQYAPTMVDGQVEAKQLDGYPDFNLGLDYRPSVVKVKDKKFTSNGNSRFLTIFLHLNNIANVAYNQWDNYPTQRFNFMVGLRMSF
ncbi:MAG TPA: hypothetical protein VK806_07605 [Bacteroidia bacterium]|jgi:hypothetical protein|nr:hypothetical protein [Bacteroidia bacterium]